MPALLFLDTNIFLQCKPLQELPWHQVCKDKDLQLVIPRVVVREIDRLKNDGKDRRARKAKRAASFISNLIDTEETIRNGSGDHDRLTVKLAQNKRLSWDLFPELDKDVNDNYLVLEALAHQNEKHNVIVVSCDVGPRATARDLGIQHFKVPDNWLLPPEPDNKDREITNLRSQLSAIKSRDPRIAVTFLDENDSPIDKVELEVLVIPDLNQDQIKEAIAYFTDKYPKASFPKPNATHVNGSTASHKPTDLADLVDINEVLRSATWTHPAEIEKYTNEDYPQYVLKLDALFRMLGKWLSVPSRNRNVTVLIENSGNVPAENFIVELTASGAIGFNDKTWKPSKILLPQPPQPPLPKPHDGLSMLVGAKHLELRGPHPWDFMSRSAMNTRESRSFYWNDKPVRWPSFHGELSCQEFRHQEQYSPAFGLEVPTKTLDRDDGAFSIRTSASNLPDPCTAILPIRVNRKKIGLLEAAEQAELNDEVLKVLRMVLGFEFKK